jgi:hypothetical protein
MIVSTKALPGFCLSGNNSGSPIPDSDRAKYDIAIESPIVQQYRRRDPTAALRS